MVSTKALIGTALLVGGGVAVSSGVIGGGNEDKKENKNNPSSGFPPSFAGKPTFAGRGQGLPAVTKKTPSKTVIEAPDIPKENFNRKQLKKEAKKKEGSRNIVTTGSGERKTDFVVEDNKIVGAESEIFDQSLTKKEAKREATRQELQQERSQSIPRDSSLIDQELQTQTKKDQKKSSSNVTSSDDGVTDDGNIERSSSGGFTAEGQSAFISSFGL